MEGRGPALSGQLALLYVQGAKEPFAQEAEAVYTKKISPMVRFSIVNVRAPSLDGESAPEKIKRESEKLLKQISPQDYVILFDESGRAAEGSEEFSRRIVKALGSGRTRTVCVIGGAFGVDESVRTRADLTLSLSRLTFNHHIAKVVVLEQVYRALTIWKGLPYHH